MLGLIAIVFVTSPGWHEFRNTFLSWSHFKSSFPGILRAFWLDVKLFVVIELVVLPLGLLIALTRTSKSPALLPLRLVATVFTDFGRGVPVVLLIYMIGFGVPALGLSWLPSNPLVLGGIALSLAYGAYVSEVYRAGIDSVHPAQRSAALALGLTETQALRHVVLPQAIRRVLPPLLNDFVALQKDVALVSFLGPIEAFRQAQIDVESSFNYTPYLAAAVLYLCVTIPLSRYVDRTQGAQRRSIGGLA